MAEPDLQELLRQAKRFSEEGRAADAAALYQRVLAARPELANTWYNFARMLRMAGRNREALDAYQQALARGASEPEEIHLNRAVILAEQRREDAAEQELERALALNPNYVPALLNLGNLNEDRGKRGAALALYQRALIADPRSAEALARVANLQSVRDAHDPLVGQLRAAIASPATNAAEEANLGFVLGKLLDACGAYDEAFAAYTAANRASRESAGAVYDRAAQERLVDELIRTFPLPLEGVKSADAEPPIFICGMFRSGSTLAEQILASHSRVTAGGEMPFLPALARTELAPFPAALAQKSRAELDAIAARYLANVREMFPSADVVTDKRPDNFLYIGLIKTLFPHAKIVHSVREPLDNCLSIFFLHLDQSMSYALDLSDIGHYYKQYKRLMAHWKALYGDDILDFDYDALVREPRPAIARLLEFCGLEWDEACLSFHRTENAVKTASVWQVREPLYTRASGRWRNYEKELGPLRKELGDLP